MKKLWEKQSQKLTPAISIIAGFLSLFFLPEKAFRDVTQELIAILGLMMAGVLPAMVLTATVLRAGNFSVKKLIEYRDALRKQMLFWIGMFTISLISSTMIVVGKILNWEIPISIKMHFFLQISFSFDAIKILNAIITTSVTLTLLRSISVGNGVISLLRLSSELAIGEAQIRDKKSHDDVDELIRKLPERPGYGSFVDIAH